MKKSKNVLALITAAVRAASFAGCTAEPPENSPAGNTEAKTLSEAEKNEPDETKAEDTEPAETEEKDSEPAETEEKENSGEKLSPSDFNTDGTIEETILYDENDVKITANELTYGGYSAELKITIENNSDTDISVKSNTLAYSCNSVNGYMIPEGYMNKEIGAGKKAIEKLSFGFSEMMIYGIFEIADIEVGFDIDNADGEDIAETGPVPIKTSLYESHDYSGDPYAETVTSEKTSNTVGYSVDEFIKNDIYDDGALKIISALSIAKGDEKAVMIEIENVCGEPAYARFSDICVNGVCFKSGSFSGDTVYPGKRAVHVLSLNNIVSEEQQEVLGINGFGNLSFVFGGFDWSEYDYAYSENVEIKFKDAEDTDMSGTEILNEGGLRAVYKGKYTDQLDDINLLFLVENQSGENYTLDIGDSLSVNGFAIGGFNYSRTIYDKTVGVFEVSIGKRELEDVDISRDDVSEAEFTLEYKKSWNDETKKNVKLTL